MDANGLKFWMLANQRDWRLEGGTHYDDARRVLRLASQRNPPVLAENRARAISLLEAIPQTRDAYGTRAYYDPARQAVMATGALPGAVRIRAFADGVPPSDIAMGHDGILYLAFETARRIVLIDQRDRWEEFTLATGAFAPWRLAASPEGGVWALDRNGRNIARLTGQPLPRNSVGEFNPDVFRPHEENADPPRLRVLPRAVWPQAERAAAIACNGRDELALLTWPVPNEANGLARVRTLTTADEFAPEVRLQGVRLPYSLAWVTDERVAVLATGLDREALVYAIREVAEHTSPEMIAPLITLAGETYPLRDYQSARGPFLHTLTQPPHYPQNDGSQPLHALSLPSFAREGLAFSADVIDSGDERMDWHRLYLEAAIPPRCGVIVRLAATDERAQAPTNEDWYDHFFGEMFALAGDPNPPRGAWLRQSSEAPFHPGLLPCPPERNRAGLFAALIQRTGRAVRTLRGRYLHVEVHLIGNGRATPEVAAVRAYGSRFSYVSHYLPELYHEDAFGPDADLLLARNEATNRFAPGTRADFLERFLNNFESVLTPLEDRISHAHLLTDPATAPEEALEWLGAWLGLTFDPAYPSERRRALLQNAARLYRTHGTEGGLKLALDLVTGGGVSGGEIIVLEAFRLRRALATILGANLADETDPLLGGLARSGNSYVGDTLVLGDETKREFLALFDVAALNTGNIPAAQRQREEEAISAFFDSLAHRLLVLVHQEVEPQDLGLIRRVVELETPAHVLAQVTTASYPLLVGLASLIGVDTYLGRRPAPRPVRVDGSRLGRGDFLLHPPSLDPRLHGGLKAEPPPESAPPIADAGPDLDIQPGQNFTLDGSASRAAPGRRIRRYVWTWIQ